MPFSIIQPKLDLVPQDRDAHIRDVDRRRWLVRRDAERNQRRLQIITDLRDRLRRRRVSATATRSSVQPYSMVDESILRGRS